MDALLKKRILDFQQSGMPVCLKRDAKVTHVKDMVTTIVGGRKTGNTYLTYQVMGGSNGSSVIRRPGGGQGAS